MDKPKCRWCAYCQKAMSPTEYNKHLFQNHGIAPTWRTWWSLGRKSKEILAKLADVTEATP